MMEVGSPPRFPPCDGGKRGGVGQGVDGGAEGGWMSRREGTRCRGMPGMNRESWRSCMSADGERPVAGIDIHFGRPA